MVGAIPKEVDREDCESESSSSESATSVKSMISTGPIRQILLVELLGVVPLFIGLIFVERLVCRVSVTELLSDEESSSSELESLSASGVAKRS
jgi:hypothetical protein